MDDDRAPVPPDLRRDAILEERTDDHIGLSLPYAVDHALRSGGEQDAHVVTGCPQRTPRALAQAVERRHEQQHPHAFLPRLAAHRPGSLSTQERLCRTYCPTFPRSLSAILELWLPLCALHGFRANHKSKIAGRLSPLSGRSRGLRLRYNPPSSWRGVVRR